MQGPSLDPWDLLQFHQQMVGNKCISIPYWDQPQLICKLAPSLFEHMVNASNEKCVR